MVRLFASLLVVAGLTAGCATSNVTTSVAAFGTQTKTATTLFAEAIEGYSERRADLVENAIREQRVPLVMAAECGQAALLNPALNPTNCDVTPGRPLTDVSTALRSDQALALSRALGDYAVSLAALAGDFSAENDTLLTSLTNAGAAVGNLEGLVRSVNGSESTLEEEDLNTVAKAIAAVTSAGLQVGRDRALLDLIEASDPAVQNATSLLSAHMFALRGVVATESAMALSEAARAYQAAIDSGRKLDKPYADLQAALATHRAQLALRDPFAKLGEAHAALREAAKGGLSGEDYDAFITAMIDVADSLKAISDI